MSMKPILFNTDMVKAILDSRKTVTRRVIKGVPADAVLLSGTNEEWIFSKGDVTYHIPERYKPGDVLYVRETWQHIPCIDCKLQGTEQCCGTPVIHEDTDFVAEGCYIFKEDVLDPNRICWRPSIHMPKAAARIFLRVCRVSVQRLQDCGTAQAKDEGCTCCSQFARLWDTTIKPADLPKYGWTANPWIWAINFERCEKPEEV